MNIPRLTWAVLAITSLAFVGAPSSTEAGGVGNGLSIAVSPDGKTVVAGSANNRALYELDADTLAVKRRVHLGWSVQKMAFAPDGKTLVVECSKALHWLDVDTLKPKKTLNEGDAMSVAQQVGLLAVNVKKRPYAIKIYDMSSGEEKAALPYNSRLSVAGFGLSPDGKKLALLYGRRTDPKEENVSWKDIPEELKKKRGAALDEFKMRHDGQTSQFVVYDVTSRKPVLDTRIWYGTSNMGHMIAMHGEHTYVVAYDNNCARIDGKGEATFFQLGNSYNYAKAVSADGATLLTGGLRDGSRTSVAKLEGQPFRLKKMPGFPEYFSGFSVATDGTAYGATTAHRVVRIKPDGSMIPGVPVY